MTQMTLEMPSVAQCSVTQCTYNVNKGCRAKAITVGDELSPECDTFLVSVAHTKSASRTAGVGACKVTHCKFNGDFECSAEKITVGVVGNSAECLAFAPAS
jgi:hypothetical protein